MFPGSYRAELIDQQVHWMDIQNGRPIPSRSENWTLADGGSATFVAERHWQDYVTPKCTLEQTTALDVNKIEMPYRLTWSRGWGRECPHADRDARSRCHRPS